MISLLSRKQYSPVKSLLLALSLLLSSRHLAAENTLLGIPYTMPGQEAAIMLFTAAQPEQPEGEHLTLMSLSGGTGFGIFAFLFRLQEVINEGRENPIPVKRIMIGISQEAEAVKRIFNFPKGADDALILEDEFPGEPSDTDDYYFSKLTGVKEARQWVSDSRLSVGLVNDVLDYFITDYHSQPLPYMFLETLHHSENLEKAEEIIDEYERLTMTLLSSERLDIETSFRSLHYGYVEDMIDYGQSLNNISFPPGSPLQAQLGIEFGLRPHKIGLLLTQPDSGTNHLKRLSLLSGDELKALTGASELKKALPFFVSGDYYTSYMHTLFANLQFIQTISLATNKKSLTLIMKMAAEDFEDPVVIEALRKVNITEVSYWSKQSGEKVFDLRRAPQDSHGIQIRVVNMFPTPEPLIQSLVYFSQPVVGTTGELSLFRVISMGKLPLHEWMILQRYVNDEFARIAKDNDQPLLNSYFNYFSPGRKAVALRKILAQPSQIAMFSDVIKTRYNASPFLKKLIEMTFSDDSELWQTIAQIDQAIEQDSIQSLPAKLQDIAWTRIIVKRFTELEVEASVDDVLEAGREISGHAENIKTPLLKQMLNKVTGNIPVRALPDIFSEDDTEEEE